MPKFTRDVLFLSLLKMAESTRSNWRLIESNWSLYWRIQREERERCVVEVSVKWKEIKKMKDLDLKIAVDKKISELKKLSTKKKL